MRKILLNVALWVTVTVGLLGLLIILLNELRMLQALVS